MSEPSDYPGATTAGFDVVAPSYDASRRANPDLTAALVAALDAPAGARVLDLGCGTGNYAVELEARGLRVAGIDPEPAMLHRAAAKLPPTHPLVLGDGRALPFRDGVFEGAFSILVLHHVPDWPRILAEARRVLRGGRYVVFLSTREQMANFWLREYLPDELGDFVRRRMTRNELLEAFALAGFREVRVTPFDYVRGDDGALLAGSRDPKLYLDPGVRAGITLFYRVRRERLARALARLAGDIASGRIDEVMARSDRSLGDATFFSAGV